MCKTKTYKMPKSETDKKVSLFGPVNPKQNVKKEEIPAPDDELGWMELNLTVNFGTIWARACPVCARKFVSEHAYQIHVQKHKPKCVHCELKLDSWKQYEQHLPFCRQRTSAIPKQHRDHPTSRPQKKPKLKFQCQLCKRKYATERHLRSHQINRCKERYVANGWIVKI